ncbi:MAG: hypothetical protein QNJ90_01495 [Planctomycetota bacterium]|nr:hypothetical protein [Planctomycetota bacterium]
MPRPSLVFVVLLLLLAPAHAGPEDVAAARKRADAVRANLPEPTPAISLEYEGDLLIQDLWAGEITLSARATKLGPDAVWRVSERSFLDFQGGEVRENVTLHVGRDLAIRSGVFERSEEGSAISIGFARTDSGFDISRRVKKGEDWSKPEKLTMKAPTGASGTGGAALLFLRAIKPVPGTAYALPWVPNPSFKAPAKANNDEPMRLTVRGQGTFEHAGKRFETSLVDLANGGTTWTLHLSRDHKRLIAMVSRNGPVRIVPRGLGGARISEDPAEPATTWKRAFIKFGFGYHMARKELLAEAFHWQLMYEHETKVVKRWDASKPLTEFKAAWIKEFLANSKRRDVHNTRRLLAMTFGTGKVKKETADEVVFQAHANFGGGTQRTYHLRKVDGLWGIVRIDF